MKIAVYAICKDEPLNHIKRFIRSCDGADKIIICDTGSSNENFKLLQGTAWRLVSVYKICNQPWRFDDARNTSLALVPEDIDVCICLDMDEVLVEGWRKKIEAAFTLNPSTTRLRYNYVWSWNEDGTPGVTYFADKIHIRNGYRWKAPVHETLKYSGEEVQTFINDTLIEHHPDPSKSRSQYLPLLKLAVEEDPNDARMLHYYARELMFYKHFSEAIPLFRKHAELPNVWVEEASASWRYRGDCEWALGNHSAAMLCFNRAKELTPGSREPHISLAQGFRVLGEWKYVADCCRDALAITERPNSYINSAAAWSDWPQQMLDEALSKLQNN